MKKTIYSNYLQVLYSLYLYLIFYKPHIILNANTLFTSASKVLFNIDINNNYLVDLYIDNYINIYLDTI